MTLQLNAKLLQILPVQCGTGKNGPLEKHDILIECLDQYRNKVCVSMWGDKLDLSKFSVGDMVSISYYLSSKEFNGHWFTQVIATSIENLPTITVEVVNEISSAATTPDIVIDYPLLNPILKEKGKYYHSEIKEAILLSDIEKATPKSFNSERFGAPVSLGGGVPFVFKIMAEKQWIIWGLKTFTEKFNKVLADTLRNNVDFKYSGSKEDFLSLLAYIKNEDLEFF